MIDNETNTILQTIYDKLIELDTQLSTRLESPNRVYNNKVLMSLLGVKDRHLTHLRDNNRLGYSHLGNKYWYNQSAVNRILASCHIAPLGLKNGLELC